MLADDQDGVPAPEKQEPTSKQAAWRPQDTGWIATGIAAGSVASWLLIFSGWDVGSKAEWFSGAASFAAVAVALWQSIVIREQAKEDAAETAMRFRDELKAANDRTVQEVQAAERRTEKELNAANQRHAVEMEQQRELARVQRVHLIEQELKLALIRVSRAAHAFMHEIAVLGTADHIVSLPGRRERLDAINLHAKKMNLVSDDLTIEVEGVRMLTKSTEIHAAMDSILKTSAHCIGVVDEYQSTLEKGGRKADPSAMVSAALRLSKVVSDARRLAGEVLVTGWD